MPLLALLLAAAPQPALPPLQTLTGIAFERFAGATDRLCPARHLRTITPADLDWLQEGFWQAQPHAMRRRLQRTDRAAAICANRDGLSCPTHYTLEAYERLKLIPAFVRYACARDLPN